MLHFDEKLAVHTALQLLEFSLDNF